ncbi:MAG: DUF3515 domain-containing protein, partial [Tomitella sp.]|nr:DUF3515 domain-containing protein [Tomitella sp.]
MTTTPPRDHRNAHPGAHTADALTRSPPTMPQHETDTPDPGTPDSGAQEHRFHPAVIATAIALPVALIVGIVVAAILVSESGSADDGPVAVGSAPAPDATSEACTNLLAALPDTLG